MKFLGVIPTRATMYSAGYDLRASKTFQVMPGAVQQIPTGTYLEMDSDTCGLVRGRSSMSMKGRIVLEGTVDADYDGEVIVALFNSTSEPFIVHVGDKIAQIVFVPYRIWHDEEPVATIRNGGFGSTGR